MISFNIIGNKEKTIVNEPESTTISARPRLEDDFYEYINYEYLSKDQLGEDEIAHYNSDYSSYPDFLNSWNNNH